MDVELDAFSGRTNPAWTLSPAEAAALRALLGSSDGAGDDVPPPPEGLGYRGFLVRDAGRVLRVFAGTVQDGPRMWADRLGAEAWLVAKARGRGFGAVLAQQPLR
jgi:hypothetical protein